MRPRGVDAQHQTMATAVPLGPNPALALPPTVGLDAARREAATCTACSLYARATRTVFGEGATHAPLMLVGEQPGDREDVTGRPFVGPAGALLDRALGEAGIDREQIFVTNVVKHFKWRPSGKRRLHDRPNTSEVRACRPWLDLEIEIVRPKLLVALGATAAQTILGRDFRITEQRGELVQPPGPLPRAIATFHPSAILRARTPLDRERMRAALVADLATAASMLGSD